MANALIKAAEQIAPNLPKEKITLSTMGQKQMIAQKHCQFLGWPMGSFRASQTFDRPETLP